jgi:E3 ubiquitin-protein ligase synoviolin
MEGWGKHARFTAGLLSFALLDVMVAAMYGAGAMDGRPSVSILFAFEHAVLALTVLLTSVRYALWCVEQRMGREWRARAAYFAWWSLFVHAVRLGLNIMYVWIIYTAYGMPLLMFRELMQSWNAVQRELSSIIAARRIRQLIDERFHKLLDHEIAAMEDKTCTCCFNDLDTEDYGPCVRLPCNHSFHTDCLLGWFDHGEGCPVCRLDLFSEEADRMLQAQRRQQRADREEREGGARGRGRGRARDRRETEEGGTDGGAAAEADAATGAGEAAPRARRTASGRRESSARGRSASGEAGEEPDGAQRVRRRKRRLQRRKTDRGADAQDDPNTTAAAAGDDAEDEAGAVSPSASHRSTPRTTGKERRRTGADEPQAPAMTTPTHVQAPVPVLAAVGMMPPMVSPAGASTPPPVVSPGGTEAQAAAWMQYQQWQQYQMYMQAQQYQQWQQWAMYQQQMAVAAGAPPTPPTAPPGALPPAVQVSPPGAVPPAASGMPYPPAASGMPYPPAASGMPYPPAYSPFQHMPMPSGLGSPTTPQASAAEPHAPGSGVPLPTAIPAPPAAAWPQSAAIAAALSTPASPAEPAAQPAAATPVPDDGRIAAAVSSGSVGSEEGPSREEQRLARLRSLGESE